MSEVTLEQKRAFCNWLFVECSHYLDEGRLIFDENIMPIDPANMLDAKSVVRAFNEYLTALPYTKCKNFREFLEESAEDLLYDIETDVCNDFFNKVIISMPPEYLPIYKQLLGEQFEYIKKKTPFLDSTEASALVVGSLFKRFGGYKGCDINVDRLVPEINFDVMLGTNWDWAKENELVEAILPDDITEAIMPLPEDFDSFITYFIRQQGYAVSDAIKYVCQGGKTSSKFLESLKEELKGARAPGAVTVLISTSDLKLMDAFAKGIFGGNHIHANSDMTEEGPFLVIPRDAKIGFFEYWSGMGSDFNIKLDKPLCVPTAFIQRVHAEGVSAAVNGGFRLQDRVLPNRNVDLPELGWVVCNSKIINKEPPKLADFEEPEKLIQDMTAIREAVSNEL